MPSVPPFQLGHPALLCKDHRYHGDHQRREWHCPFLPCVALRVRPDTLRGRERRPYAGGPSILRLDLLLALGSQDIYYRLSLNNVDLFSGKLPRSPIEDYFPFPRLSGRIQLRSGVQLPPPPLRESQPGHGDKADLRALYVHDGHAAHGPLFCR